MSNVRECKLCGKMVDFSEPWCDHETMEESGWRNIPRVARDAYHNQIVEHAKNLVYDELVIKVAKELGFQAGQTMTERLRKDFE